MINTKKAQNFSFLHTVELPVCINAPRALFIFLTPYTQIITYMHSRILEHSNDQLLKVLAFEDFHIATQIMVNSMNGGSKASKK